MSSKHRGLCRQSQVSRRDERGPVDFGDVPGQRRSRDDQQLSPTLLRGSKGDCHTSKTSGLYCSKMSSNVSWLTRLRTCHPDSRSLRSDDDTPRSSSTALIS